ncbi:MAG: ATP-binding protein [Candidatus Eiseniibacteriota bacterium]
MTFFSSKVKSVGILSVILIVIFSFGTFYFIQNLTESEVRSSLIKEQVSRQLTSTMAVSQHIGSDLSLVDAVLDGLANSGFLQNGELSSEKTKDLMEQKYATVDQIVSRLFVLDKNDIVTIGLSPEGTDRYLGADFSQRGWVQQAKQTLRTVISDGFERQGIYTIFIAMPIINRDNNQYIGIIGASIPTEAFFSHYGNVHDINSQFLVVLNNKSTLLAVGASGGLVGKEFFGDTVQTFVNHNEILNNLTRSLLQGNSGYAIYDYGRGERIDTAHPVFVQGRPTYFLQIVTPTSAILSNIGDTLFFERLKSYSLLVGTLAAVAALIIFLIKWNRTMEKEVVNRTKELNESNRKLDGMTRELVNSNISLQQANERLREQEKIQKEFINVAAHELRTPIQPILGLSGILHSKIRNTDQREMIDIVIRNARRLQRLSQDILDVSKIESRLLKLSKSKVDLTEIIKTSISDINNTPDRGIENKNVNIEFQPKESIVVNADRDRLYQVISNLLKNALKFTEDGTVILNIERKYDINNKDHVEALVTITDSGKGIDPEILPRLFSKFATKSDTGTGLGLYISRAIIEAHGGKMWARNNENGRGATFSFSLPLADLEVTEKNPLNDKFTEE